MSIRRKVLNRVSACYEDLTRLREQCITSQQRADMDAALQLIGEAVRIVDESRALGAAERRPAMTAFDFDSLLNGQPTLVVTPNRVASARVAASSWGKRHGIRLTVSKMPDGCAVVRIAAEDVAGA